MREKGSMHGRQSVVLFMVHVFILFLDCFHICVVIHILLQFTKTKNKILARMCRMTRKHSGHHKCINNNKQTNFYLRSDNNMLHMSSVEPQNAPYTICSLEVHIVYPAYTICSPLNLEHIV